MAKYFCITIFLFTLFALPSWTQNSTLKGVVVDRRTNAPIDYATIRLKDHDLWAVSDGKGAFSISNVPTGKVTLMAQCLGYVTTTMTVEVSSNMPRLTVALNQESLRLGEVEVVAKRRSDAATTSYTIDRLALDNQQITNLADIATLLPGGKTVNPTLMNDNRLALRSGSTEKGNASFGTAIEIDGVRIDNNAAMGETAGASLRSVGTTNIESVEVVSGIASVEYGDMSNGVVKVQTRRGKSPFIVEGKLTQHTRQIALAKGFDLGARRGVLNVSIEHARSFADAASPHTAYARNALSLSYNNVVVRGAMPLTLNLGFTANVGGYNSKADPDRELESYDRVRDNAYRASMELNWQLNKPWITGLSLKTALNFTDRRTENYYNTSSASTQPYIHTTTEGYYIATPYDDKPEAEIILGPTGYWYVRRYVDSKPLDYSVRLKAFWTRAFGRLRHHLLLGADLTGSANRGRGTYYEDMRYAPTWRPYRYDALPMLHNLGLYAEERVRLQLPRTSSLELTAGLRADATYVGGSAYGTMSTVSPRAKLRYVAWQGRKGGIKELSFYAGWGKSAKLPSFQVLYPSPNYTDKLSFASPSSTTNVSFYAYHTLPSTALYNPDLKLQYTNQIDLGLSLNLWGTRLSLSAFHHRTHNPYMATTVYTPYSYNFTNQTAAASSGIAAANRVYGIDRETGVVTVTDATGVHNPVQLASTTRNTYYTRTKYVNSSPVDRYGLEWILDFAPIRPLNTSLRIDGNYYYYKGIDETLFADVPGGLTTTMSNGQLYQYVGYYRGGSATSTSYAANASVANGSLSRRLNLNATLTTHIPRVRMVVALRVEASLYSYSRPLSELSNATRGYVAESGDSYFGTPYDGSSRDAFVLVYPEYYATWDEPDNLIPFAEKLAWAYENDRALYNDLSKLVVRSNYAYTMNPNRISSYYSANLSVTKEIGDKVQVSFYANNFFNNLKKVKSSQTGLETSLFGSSYIPSFYYGLALRLKL